MNVETLIQQLEKLPKDAKVLVVSGPDALDEIIATKLLRVTPKSPPTSLVAATKLT